MNTDVAKLTASMEWSMERLADLMIFAAGPGDAADLARVHVDAWRQTYQGLLPAPYLAAMNPVRHAGRWRHQLTAAPLADVVLAAEGPEGVVGYCAGALVGEAVAEVSTLYLLKSAQGLGLGGRLLAACARVLQAREARSLRLWVLDGNVRARGFYEHLGGVADARRPVSGWGGGLTETAYRWADIGVLARR